MVREGISEFSIKERQTGETLTARNGIKGPNLRIHMLSSTMGEFFRYIRGFTSMFCFATPSIPYTNFVIVG